MKYFWKYSYYALIGVLFAFVLSAMIGEMKWELIPIIILNMFIVRLLDDCFDYAEDKKIKKKQLLNYKQLIWATVICCIIYLVLNMVFFGLWGLFALLMILYMVVENKHESLKLFFVSLASMYYIGAYRELTSTVIMVYLILMVVLSVGFYMYKRQKRVRKGIKKK